MAPRRNLISNEEFPLHSKVKTDNRWPSTTSRVVGANGVAPQSAHYEVEKRESERYGEYRIDISAVQMCIDVIGRVNKETEKRRRSEGGMRWVERREIR